MTETTRELTTDELLEELGAIYTREFGDWVLEASTILTEPVAPGVVIKPEDWPEAAGPAFGGFQGIGNTLMEAVRAAALHAYSVLIQRQPYEPSVPWTNFDDDEALKKIIAALDAKGAS